MDNPFRSARSHLDFKPAAKWGAVLCSAGAAICLALLFPVLYLFVDLIDWHGQVPTYATLSPARQAAFQDQWNARALAATPADATEWESRWQKNTYAVLDRDVGREAADAYLPLLTAHAGRSEPNRELGVLGTVVRERDRWTARVLGWFAGWNPWSWRPGASGSANVAYLTGLFLIAFALLLLRGILLNVAAHLSAVATIAAATRLRRALYTHGSRLTAVAVRPDAQEEAGDLVTRRVEQVQDGLAAWLTGSVRWMVVTVLLLLVLLVVHFWLTLCLLLLAGVVWLVVGQAAAWFRRDARLAARRSEARLGTMRESMSLMQLVKAYLMERYSKTRFERQLTEVSRSAWRRARGETYSRPTLVAVASLAGAAMLFLAGRVVLAGEMSIAGLAVKAAAIATLVYALNRWIASQVRVARARDAAADVFEFLDRRGETGQAIDAEFLQPMRKNLELVGVSLRESGTGRMVLEDVSLTIPAGTRAAVVFTDPDEARALAHLITRFLDPTAGEVRIDGKNTRWVTYESVRAQVALVTEDALTFADTVANNIGCGDPGFTLPQIIEAAKTAHAHQFVQRLPYGYETQIGDGGVILRPGERYRIALARAILRDPSLLVIEEPAETLDPDSLVLIDDTIARIRHGRTVLFLARRPSTVKSADEVFVMHNGRLKVGGSHDELIHASELYRLLHFKQSLTAAEGG
ncbi:MAG TPA: ABC transporter ATP-binding protein [Fimbriiglobus sp.]|nr:ABC transporter ATP-binding protein [Fimbriiglobus sp.]